MQLHSHGAALLLVWAANVIKQYAAYKWLGEDPSEPGQPYMNLHTHNTGSKYKQRDLRQITIETKIKMKQE